MSEPNYTLVKHFKRVEAVGMRGARHGDLHDPISLRIRVTEGTDIDDVVEEISQDEGRSSGRLRRLRRGSWSFKVNPTLMTPGKTYTVHWIFQMTPGNDNVTRSTFLWEPLPPIPDTGKTIIYGQLVNAAGDPVPDTNLYLEEYRDFATLTHRLSQVTLSTDDFGIWWAEVEHKKIVRFVLGEVSKIVQAPANMARVALSELPSFQHTDIIRKDRYGYPLPSQNLFEALARRLSRGEAVALLSSMSVVKHVTICDDSQSGPVEGTGGVEYDVFEQPVPSTVWTIEHNKDCLPVVSVIDEDACVVFPDVSYPDSNTVVLTFGTPQTGKALLLCQPGG